MAPDLPAGDESLGLNEYADTVVEAIGDPKDLVVVGQSFGAFTAPLVADRLPTDVLVLVAGMIPSPGEPPGDWWKNTGYASAVQEQSARDGGKTGNDDPYVTYYHDVPREFADEAMSKERDHPSQASMEVPWPPEEWPDVPIVPDEIAAGHCLALSRPKELARLLEGYAAGAGTGRSAPQTQKDDG